MIILMEELSYFLPKLNSLKVEVEKKEIYLTKSKGGDTLGNFVATTAQESCRQQIAQCVIGDICCTQPHLLRATCCPE